MVCPSGPKGEGGTCQCQESPYWIDDGSWSAPSCHYGTCKMAQANYWKCLKKRNGYVLEAGKTWCYKQGRGTKCPLILGMLIFS